MTVDRTTGEPIYDSEQESENGESEQESENDSDHESEYDIENEYENSKDTYEDEETIDNMLLREQNLSFEKGRMLDKGRHPKKMKCEALLSRLQD